MDVNAERWQAWGRLSVSNSPQLVGPFQVRGEYQTAPCTFWDPSECVMLDAKNTKGVGPVMDSTPRSLNSTLIFQGNIKWDAAAYWKHPPIMSDCPSELPFAAPVYFLDWPLQASSGFRDPPAGPSRPP